ncbi:uncharacterized protein LOC114849707 [Betta splendens]|uniref:Uncharacterized protein LOC114849707 n=1 Tax=Betta splendens TaxID=158456 RepID=A0A6P7LTI8_BETSP|nr:uncharacterized protein LOC114849707 [Betta splendens]
MVGATGITTSLVLLCLTRTGADAWIFSERAYDIKYPCEGGFGEVCFHMWEISKGTRAEYVAVVSNGELQRAVPEDKCIVHLSNLTDEDVGHHHCRRRNNDFSSQIAPESKKTASLQCVFLTYIERTHCYTQQQRWVDLTWVDEAGNAVQEDAQHQIKKWTSCNTTLSVSLQRAETKTFRCQVAVGEQTQTSPALTVGASDLKRSGRRFQVETANQGGPTYAAWGAAGVVACVAVSAALAVFVTNKRRRNSQLLHEPSSVQHTSNNVLTSDDLIYADICFSAGSERVLVQECESTEYACVRCN